LIIYVGLQKHSIAVGLHKHIASLWGYVNT